LLLFFLRDVHFVRKYEQIRAVGERGGGGSGGRGDRGRLKRTRPLLKHVNVTDSRQETAQQATGSREQTAVFSG
jgi:hypothetical protein